MTINHLGYKAPFSTDFYKVGHIKQYPKGMEYLLSNMTPRSGSRSNVPDNAEVVVAGVLATVNRVLAKWMEFIQGAEWQVHLFKRVMDLTLGVDVVDVEHLHALRRLGYLPIEIRALQEGTLVPYRVPYFTIRNTHPDFAWLTNYLETEISSEMAGVINSATTAFAYRRLCERWAAATGGDRSFVPFQCHDFSYRGILGGTEAAAQIGLGHLMSFVGSDNIPAIMHVYELYNDAGEDIYDSKTRHFKYEGEPTLLVGTSIPATEHSVMCAGGEATEEDTFDRLIFEIHPSGMVSVVSDTWDFWSIIGNYLPSRRDAIMARDGKVVIRPDSGDPVKILTGDDDAEEGSLEHRGLIGALWDIFGGIENEKGFKVLDSHIGAIYGDSITLERAEEIFRRLAAKGFASTNMVLGVGSFTYQYVTRDTHGQAMKATHMVLNGVEAPLFKNPKTDDGTKRSAKGRPMVFRNEAGRLELREEVSEEEFTSDANELVQVFHPQMEVLKYDLLWGSIRNRLEAQL